MSQYMLAYKSMHALYMRCSLSDALSVFILSIFANHAECAKTEAMMCAQYR